MSLDQLVAGTLRLLAIEPTPELVTALVRAIRIELAGVALTALDGAVKVVQGEPGWTWGYLATATVIAALAGVAKFVRDVTGRSIGL
jgi:hypothetical protein